jgi:hypothetical protein
VFRDELGGFVNESRNETAGGLLVSEELFDLFAQIIVRAALAVEEGGAVVRVALKRRREE